MKYFKWRDITDGILFGEISSGNYNRKIFVKGIKNRVYITTINKFLQNNDNIYDYCWLPINEKAYLFSNMNAAFFNNDHQLLNRPPRRYRDNDEQFFHDKLDYNNTLKNIINN